ncbi:ADP-ribose 1''-phosphate phosphatase [Lithohypha guttulata]|nr:ADP-ribose 1''-phosphate phosphatase [Lithohypha guttulata]
MSQPSTKSTKRLLPTTTQDLDRPRKQRKNVTTPQQPSSTFTLLPTQTILSTLPSDTILLHSTNCFGEWGAGIALAIAHLLPAANAIYTTHCDSFRADPRSWPEREKLVGTCLFIPPLDADTKRNGGKEVWVACLFTSYGYGRATERKAGKDGKAVILRQTRGALGDLRGQLEGMREKDGKGGEDAKNEGVLSGDEVEMSDARAGAKKQGRQLDIYSPQFNSGSFGVKWEETEILVKEVFAGWDGKWFILSPPK